MRWLPLPLLVILCWPAASGADSGNLSLKDAVGLALARNQNLLAARHGRDAAREETGITRSRYLPRLILEEGAMLTNSPTQSFMLKLNEGRFSLSGDLNHPSNTGDFRTTLILEQPLLDFSIGRNVAAADASDRARGLDVERLREDVVHAVITSYLDVRLGKARVATAVQAVADAREHLRLAGVRLGAGTGLKADELRARTFVAEREIDVIRARNDLRLAQLRLGRVIGEKGGVPADTADDSLSADAVSLSADLVATALTGRSDLAAAAAQVERAEAGVSLARASYLPTIYGSASYQMNDRDLPFGRDNDAWTIGAVLRWELFDGFRRGHETARARAERDAAREALEARRADAALQVEEKRLRLEEARKRLEVARSALADAEETMRLVNCRFENSLATMVETLDAQNALNAGRSTVVDAETGSARAAADLLHAAGILREVMK